MTHPGDLLVCPHCWAVNSGGSRLCHVCGADPTLLLQESGGLRWTAPVQSPVPVTRGRRLSRAQRIGAAACLLVLAIGFAAGALGLRVGLVPGAAPAATR
ncbi:MAG TPA: hypothetical protein VK837_01570 [Longimicrobiales bacterium]|nr:hypothetical protein [Longimicrobiales bacterium]